MHEGPCEWGKQGPTPPAAVCSMALLPAPCGHIMPKLCETHFQDVDVKCSCVGSVLGRPV